MTRTGSRLTMEPGGPGRPEPSPAPRTRVPGSQPSPASPGRSGRVYGAVCTLLAGVGTENDPARRPRSASQVQVVGGDSCSPVPDGDRARSRADAWGRGREPCPGPDRALPAVWGPQSPGQVERPRGGAGGRPAARLLPRRRGRVAGGECAPQPAAAAAAAAGPRGGGWRPVPSGQPGPRPQPGSLTGASPRPHPPASSLRQRPHTTVITGERRDVEGGPRPLVHTDNANAFK